ncbi:M42 family metallopeptidase [Chitinophagales bacterium]|nr:M42 family metallopeptidase [Chitinophagales bacterium]
MAKILDKKSMAFLEALVNNPSPVSHEWRGQQLWLEYLKSYVDEVHVDVYGTAYGIINPGKDYKVLIEAHADEISWMVHRITDEGLIYVKRNGGSDHIAAPSKRVNIFGKKGIVKGVFGWPAIHTRHNGKEDTPKPHTIFVDVGADSKKEVEKLGIHIGNVMIYDDGFEVLNGKYFMGRALDNRVGGFMIAQVARLLKEEKTELPYSLYIVNSVMEEVGLRGAEMIANTIKPDVAIITDVAHDTSTPLIDKNIHGDFACGKGPMIAYGPSVHNKLLEIIEDTATKQKIPFQREANSRRTGTDTDAFAFANGGIPSALISLPQKYMHTTAEMVHRDDVENVITLIKETLKKIKYKHDFHYFSV